MNIDSKACNTCLETKSISEFRFTNSKKNKYQAKCSLCTKAYHASWAASNRERVSEHQRKYATKPENKKTLLAYNAKRRRSKYKNDTQYRLTTLMRNRFKECVKTGWISSKLKYLGCSIEDYKTYLEALFTDGMSWNNWAIDGWHIDHIIPICNFDLTQESERHKAFHYTNTQPLWAVENLKKPKFVKRDC